MINQEVLSTRNINIVRIVRTQTNLVTSKSVHKRWRDKHILDDFFEYTCSLPQKLSYLWKGGGRHDMGLYYWVCIFYKKASQARQYRVDISFLYISLSLSLCVVS